MLLLLTYLMGGAGCFFGLLALAQAGQGNVLTGCYNLIAALMCFLIVAAIE